MKAPVVKQAGLLEVQFVPELGAGPDEIKVEIAYTGICDSDLEKIAGSKDIHGRPMGSIGRHQETAPSENQPIFRAWARGYFGLKRGF
jgi:threonine dehydrogenase-like Zn-dependent dehydrogenase